MVEGAEGGSKEEDIDSDPVEENGGSVDEDVYEKALPRDLEKIVEHRKEIIKEAERIAEELRKRNEGFVVSGRRYFAGWLLALEAAHFGLESYLGHKLEIPTEIKWQLGCGAGAYFLSYLSSRDIVHDRMPLRNDLDKKLGEKETELDVILNNIFHVYSAPHRLREWNRIVSEYCKNAPAMGATTQAEYTTAIETANKVIRMLLDNGDEHLDAFTDSVAPESKSLVVWSTTTRNIKYATPNYNLIHGDSHVGLDFDLAFEGMLKHKWFKAEGSWHAISWYDRTRGNKAQHHILHCMGPEITVRRQTALAVGDLYLMSIYKAKPAFNKAKLGSRKFILEPEPIMLPSRIQLFMEYHQQEKPELSQETVLIT